MKIIHAIVLTTILSICGCCHTVIRSELYVENNTHHTIYISSSTTSADEFQIKSQHCELIEPLRGDLIISNRNGSFWIINDFDFNSYAFRGFTDEKGQSPLFLKSKRSPIPFINHITQSIKIRVNIDALFVMPVDERLHYYYKRLQPEGFPKANQRANQGQPQK